MEQTRTLQGELTVTLFADQIRVPNYLDPTEEDLEEWEAKDAALTDEYFQYLDWKYGERKEKA